MFAESQVVGKGLYTYCEVPGHSRGEILGLFIKLQVLSKPGLDQIGVNEFSVQTMPVWDSAICEQKLQVSAENPGFSEGHLLST